MGLTTGTGALGPKPLGRHNAQVPDRFVLVEPFPRRVRGMFEGRTVVDSDAVSFVHVRGCLPRYSFPASDVGTRVPSEADPEMPGNVTVPWDGVDAWYEEDERVIGHPRDPYHRIDTFRTSRRVAVALGGVELARSTRAHALYETGLPARWYLSRADVRMEHLGRSTTTSQCPYKGTAHYWSARAGARSVDDVAWSYQEEVRREGQAVQWLLSFDDSKVEVTVDGVVQG